MACAERARPDERLPEHPRSPHSYGWFISSYHCFLCGGKWLCILVVIPSRAAAFLCILVQAAYVRLCMVIINIATMRT